MTKTINSLAEEVLAAYNLTGVGPYRIKGGIAVTVRTDDPELKGQLFLRETAWKEENIKTRCDILKKISEAGIKTDYPIVNAAGTFLTTLEDESVYMVSKWYQAEECDTHSVNDVLLAVRHLASLHNIFSGMDTADCKGEFPIARNLLKEYDRRNTELRKIRNFFAGKRKKTEFELVASKNIDEYIIEGERALGLLSDTDYELRYNEAADKMNLVHGDYNYHNCMFGRNYSFICGFDSMHADLFLSDLYNFLRKILEKYEWDIKVAYLLLNEYSRERALSDSDVHILGCMFAYPEKFRKIMNYYYNSNKAWLPPKSKEKLWSCIASNRLRKEFVKTLI